MILKGTILSMERVPLRARELPVERATTVAAEVEAARLPVVPEPEPLDLNTVVQWLEEQDAAVRASLALMLAGDIEQLRVAASREAAQEGHEEGLTRARSETAAGLATFASLAQAADAAFQRESNLLAEQCAEIVAAALTRIAGPALTGRDAVLGVVTNLLARLKDDREVVVRASEEDLAFLESEMAALRAAASGRSVSLVADRRVTLGGCIVETRLGSLDGRLETQLAGLFETIRAARAAREEPA